MSEIKQQRPAATRDDVFLLYLDILGFKELSKRKSMDDLEKLFKNMVVPIATFKTKKNERRALSFSDTVIIWESPDDTTPLDAFVSLCSLGGVIWTEYLAAGVPIRGIITYGPFRSLTTTEDQAQVFFGDALIQAHIQERDDNWIGIRADEAAVAHAQKILTSPVRTSLGRLRKTNTGHVLMLNPLFELYRFVNPSDRSLLLFDKVEKELRALSFLLHQSHRFRIDSDVTGLVAQKYFATLMFISDALGERGFELVATIAGKARFPLTQESWDALVAAASRVLKNKESKLARR